MCFGHAQTSHQERYRFGCHEGAAIGVQGQFAFLRSAQTDLRDLAGFSVASSLDHKQSRSRFESGHAYPVEPHRT